MKNARETIVDLLTTIEKEETYMQLLLKKELDNIKKEDRGFITEVVYGTVKHQLKLDYFINHVSKTPVKKMKPFIKHLMRMSAYQLIFLDKIPASATINEAVKLVKKRKMHNLSGFVNGVLRNLERQKDEISLPDVNTHKIEHFSIKYSMPSWLIEMWLEMYGTEEMEKICTAFNERAEVCIRINKNQISKNELILELQNEGIECSDGIIFPEDNLYLKKTYNIGNLNSFLEGKWTPQDESASLVSHLLNPQKGDKILDMCAAPGGKSTHIAELSNDECEIISADLYPHKTELIQKNADRLNLKSIKIIVNNGINFNKSWEDSFERILLDVPCSGLGVIKRKPDMRYHKTPEDILAISEVQKQLVNNAVRYLKAGGTLLYSTCTLSKIENEDMVKYILNLGLKLDPITDDVPDLVKPYIKEENHIQILPYIAKTDGFFIARFKK
ncbi:MAG: 16S rRNA (cytosine(967)-C(5))-methyltransferase [Epulopiscium sp. Nele67-Bin005]|nr:MAG: 16S rRNA (cytosine(967)-C(5))-methyltransferase [Epulopiscium sp. Nele67-Bin005]